MSKHTQFDVLPGSARISSGAIQNSPNERNLIATSSCSESPGWDKTTGQKRSKSTRKSLLTGFLMVPLLLLSLALAPMPAAAQLSETGNVCGDEVGQFGSCAAGDVNILSLDATPVDVCSHDDSITCLIDADCGGGNTCGADVCDNAADTIKVKFIIDLDNVGGDRYDPAYYVALNGLSARTGDSCLHGALTSGTNLDADSCFDLAGGETTVVTTVEVELNCTDVDEDEFLDAVDICTSAKTFGGDSVCNDVTGAFANPGSKCECSDIELETPIPVPFDLCAGVDCSFLNNACNVGVCDADTGLCESDPVPATTICRPGSGDLCDPDESCSGVAGEDCPADLIATATTICNPGSGDVCDTDESCTGTPGAACPDDSIASATTICRTGSGDLCDLDESCTGVADAACPDDVVASATTICNPGSGDVCDTDESCTGTPGAACPDDSIASATTICRTGSGDLCDLDESCTGVADAACPDDVVASATTICNPGSGDVCDTDESCTGTPGAACPDDSIASATTICRTGSGDLCDLDESCTGVADAACPDDVVASATTICNPGSGDLCDLDESCTGTPGAACPDDTIAPPTTICRTGSGDLCDLDESCTGVADAACPDDVVASATTICNPGSGDLCDPDESCTGTPGAACPDDVVASATTICNAGSGDLCDPDESCTGAAGVACPDDTIAPPTTICRPGEDACNLDESCTGESDAACPADDDQPLPMLTVTKFLPNDDGGNLVESDFIIDLEATQDGLPFATSFPGDPIGTEFTLDPGPYTVSETLGVLAEFYAVSYSGDCAVDGTGILACADTLQCIVINDDIPQQNQGSIQITQAPWTYVTDPDQTPGGSKDGDLVVELHGEFNVLNVSSSDKNVLLSNYELELTIREDAKGKFKELATLTEADCTFDPSTPYLLPGAPPDDAVDVEFWCEEAVLAGLGIDVGDVLKVNVLVNIFDGHQTFHGAYAQKIQ